MDPAEQGRRRRVEILVLLNKAETAESDAEGYDALGQEEAENYALTAANNFRLRAICLQVGIRQPLKEEDA